MFACESGLPIRAICTDEPEFITPTFPDFSCPAESIEYSVPVADKSIYMQYWTNCASGVSGLPDVSAINQGWVNQLFCDTDAFGYPMAPASAGTPLAGCVSQVVTNGATVSAMATEIDPAYACSGNNSDLEMIQLDFWMLIPDYIQNVGVRINGPAADAALIMICLLYTSPSPRDRTRSRMPSSA